LALFAERGRDFAPTENSMTGRALIFLAALGLGCAMPALPELDASHPASTDAREAPAPPPSATLSVEAVPTDGPPPSANPHQMHDMKQMDDAPSDAPAHGGHHGHH
jgi:hypothetical protein